jgi:hypothetical protein
MKSTARMMGAWRGWDTRRQNELRLKALKYHIKEAIAHGWGLPNILRHAEGGWELSIDFGHGYCFLRFETWHEAADWLIKIAPHCERIR